MRTKDGKLIVFYGPNGAGKTTQIELMVEFLKSLGIESISRKCPDYKTLTGQFIYKYIRDPEFRVANHRTPRELHQIYYENRSESQEEIVKLLSNGVWVLLEDYVASSIAWGLTHGENFEELLMIDQTSREPDLSILLYGKRHDGAYEQGHIHESAHNNLDIYQNFLRVLANFKHSDYRSSFHLGRDWLTVDCNGSIEEVNKRIVGLIKERFKYVVDCDADAKIPRRL